MKRNQIVCTAFLAAITLIGATGCNTSNSGRDQRSEGRSRDDRDISARVQRNLNDEPVYKFGGVNVRTFAGQVQLSGFVDSEEQRRRAGEVASQTPGVATVYNALVLKPQPVMPTGRMNTFQQPSIYANPQGQGQSQSQQPLQAPKDAEPK